MISPYPQSSLYD